jgi:hypothetical protein
MKRIVKLGGKVIPTALWMQLMTALSGLLLAIAYSRAAQRDEKNGYAFTAALEWRKAAELMSPIPALADRCWTQWERVMHLPRRLAQPIPAPAQMPAGASSLVC